eukprot:gb/GFBE01012474.1/.p1 GENE.gb/GFBE01012474.1/~~gb/GFBE01012474.1/.p1  ORF type:complete len:207 (+),score=29.59 gb/GFBE01012474.1/:1-621(+)
MEQIDEDPEFDDADDGSEAGGKKRRRGGKARGARQESKPPPELESIGRSILTAKMKKTRMCDFHKEGRCKYGQDCAFAHDESELQNAPDLRKTRLCRAFTQGKCNDSDCKFAHGEAELRASDICFKTALCTWYEKGNCQSGSACRFAHGESELREDPDAQAAAERKRRREAEDGPRKRPRHSTLCNRCGSTIATALGYTYCVLCRC